MKGIHRLVCQRDSDNVAHKDPLQRPLFLPTITGQVSLEQPPNVRTDKPTDTPVNRWYLLEYLFPITRSDAEAKDWFQPVN